MPQNELTALCGRVLCFYQCSCYGDTICSSPSRGFRSATPVKHTRYTGGNGSESCLTCSGITHPRCQGNGVCACYNTHSWFIKNGDHGICRLSATSGTGSSRKQNGGNKLGRGAQTASLSIPVKCHHAHIHKRRHTFRRQLSFCRFCQAQSFSNARPNRVILISRQSHSRQNADNGHHDHQFDQGEPLLCKTLHTFLLGVG